MIHKLTVLCALAVVLGVLSIALAAPVGGKRLTKKLAVRGLGTSAVTPVISDSSTSYGTGKGVKPSLGAVTYLAKFAIRAGATDSVVGYTIADPDDGSDQRFVPLNADTAIAAGAGAYEFEFSGTDNNAYNLYTEDATTLDEISLVEVAR